VLIVTRGQSGTIINPRDNSSMCTSHHYVPSLQCAASMRAERKHEHTSDYEGARIIDVRTKMITCNKDKLSWTTSSLAALQNSALLAYHSDVLESRVAHKRPRVTRYRYRFYARKHGRSKSRCVRSFPIKCLEVGDSDNFYNGTENGDIEER